MIDISRATLDVIEAIKTKQTIKFNYGHDSVREIKPSGFFGDFEGFEGTDQDTEEREFRRFRFNKVTDWVGIGEDKLLNLELAYTEAMSITKDAKHLSYPVVELQVKLSNLAENNNLTYEMDCCLDVVGELQSKLESAFFECDQVFLDAIEDERLRREEYD
jgi:hypothetical protein